jgi:hypothetical protein
LTFSAASSDFTKYMTAQYVDEKLKIFTLEEFKNFELQETVSQMTLELRFVCTGEIRSLTFYQNIKAVNNFNPEFSQSSYEIIIPTPLPKGLDITMFLDSKIRAIDRDLQFFQLKFSIAGTSLFSVEEILEPESKFYTAKLLTTQQITRLDGNTEFSLTATASQLTVFGKKF